MSVRGYPLKIMQNSSKADVVVNLLPILHNFNAVGFGLQSVSWNIDILLKVEIAQSYKTTVLLTAVSFKPHAPLGPSILTYL